LTAWERHEEAIRRADQAVAAGPIDIDTNSFRGYTYYFARRYEDAIVAWERLLDLHPDQLTAHSQIAIAHVLLGRNDEGLQRARNAVSLADGAPWARVALAKALALAGKGSEAQRVLSDAASAAPEGLDPLATAQAYAALGDPDHAFHWMDVAGGGDHGWLMFLRVEPAYDLLRTDPRFRGWLHYMRLVE
jgi:adenylate cyclase